MPLSAGGPNPQQLPISILNACSLTCKVTEVQQLITSRGIKLMCLAETWLSSNVDDGEVSIPNLAVHRRDHGQRGGGVAIYSHDSLLVRRCTERKSEHLEVIWLNVFQERKSYMFGCCYRPPSELATYWDLLETNLERVVERAAELVTLVGDFNVDMMETRHNQALVNILSASGLVNHVAQTTRITSHSQTAIDLLLSTTPPVSPCEITPTDISDHFALLARFDVGISPSIKAKKLSRSLYKVNWVAFNQDLHQNLAAFTIGDDLDSAVATRYHLLMNVLDKHAPLTMKRKKAPRHCPWLTAELVQLV